MTKLTAYPITFVGAGPGDPDLITVAGRRALEEADLIIYAGSLVSPAMLDWTKPEAERIDSAGLTLETIIEHMGQAYGQGQRVVRLHTGDPSLYGAIAEQFKGLEAQGIPYRVIPGVSAAFAAAAALGLEFTLPELTQTLIFTRISGKTPVPLKEDLAALAAHQSSLAIYLSAGRAAAVVEALRPAYGPTAPMAIIYRASWPDQRIIWTTVDRLAVDLEAARIDRQAILLVGPAVTALEAGEASPKSRLYDSTFSHGYRQGLADE